MKAGGIVGRSALVLAGVAAAAFLIEIALQLGSWLLWAGDREPRARAAWLSDRHRVLCLGDSNTYGIGVPP